MASQATLRTPYDLRVELIKETILAHSRVDDDVAGQLAVHVLHTLNSIPETIR